MYVDIDPKINKEYLLSITKELLNSPELVLEGPGEEDLFPVKIDNDDVFYHGTSEVVGKIIDEIGRICIRKITETVPSYEEETKLLEEIGYDTRGRIYLTTNINKAQTWAFNRASFDKSSPVIYKINGEDINNAICKATVDSFLFYVPIQSIVLKGCDCIKATKVLL